jgi:hypothetical protein
MSSSNLKILEIRLTILEVIKKQISSGEAITVFDIYLSEVMKSHETLPLTNVDRNRHYRPTACGQTTSVEKNGIGG